MFFENTWKQEVVFVFVAMADGPRGRLGAIVWSLAHITQAPPNTRPCWWPNPNQRILGRRSHYIHSMSFEWFNEETQLLLLCIQRFHVLSLWFCEVIINHLARLLKQIKLKTRAHPFLRDLRKTNPRTPSLFWQSGSSWNDCQLDADWALSCCLNSYIP